MTGFVFDERMLLHEGTLGHVEQPGRARAILARLTQEGHVIQCRALGGREASDAELLRVHSAASCANSIKKS